MSKHLIIAIVFILFVVCSSDKDDGATSTLAAYFKSLEENRYEQALSFWDSIYRPEVSLTIRRMSSEFYRNASFVQLDTVDGYYKILVLHNGQVPRYWWMKMTRTGPRLIIPIYEFTSTWEKKSGTYTTYHFSPGSCDELEDGHLETMAGNLDHFFERMAISLDFKKEDKLEYYHFATLEEFADIASLPTKKELTGILSFSTRTGYLFTTKEIDTLMLISYMLREKNVSSRPFFSIGLYIGYCKNNAWDNLSTHLWTAAYIRDSIEYSLRDLLRSRQGMCTIQHPDVSWLVAGSFCEFVVSKYGLLSYLQLANQYTQDSNLDSICLQLFGVNARDTEEEWKNYAVEHVKHELPNFTTTKTSKRGFLEIVYCTELKRVVEPIHNEIYALANIVVDSLAVEIDYPIRALFLNIIVGNKLIPGWQTHGTAHRNQLYIKSHMTGSSIAAERISNLTVFMHELVHVLLRAKIDVEAAIPKWLDEGLAYYLTSLEFKEHSPVHELNKVTLQIEKGKPLYGLESLHGRWQAQYGVEDPVLALHTSYLFIEYLIQNYGWRRMRTLLDNVADSPRDFDSAFQRTYNANLKSIQDDWSNSMRTKPLSK